MDLLSRVGRDLKYAQGIVQRRPLQMLVQITNRCNARCGFCDFWRNGARPEDELTTDDYARVAGELAGLGKLLVSIEGGEPFLRPDLIEIVRVFGRDHIPLLYTNGWRVTAENARALFDAGLQQVGVSIDFPDAERHDESRGLVGGFERAKEAVRHFRDAADQGAHQVHLMSVLMRENQDELAALLDLSAELGVGHAFTVLSASGYRRGQTHESMPDAGVGARLRALWGERKHLRLFRSYLDQIDPFLDDGEMPTCHAGEQTFNLDHLGNMAACIERIDKPVGNVRDASAAELARALSEQREEVSTCQACWTVCRGYATALGQGSSARDLVDLTRRMRS